MGRRPNRDLELAFEERQVLSLLMSGLRYDEIAKQMKASTVTVRGWAQRMRDKSGARTNAQAVYLACKAMWDKPTEGTSAEPVQRRRVEDLQS